MPGQLMIELRELDEDELEARLAESRRELLNLRFQLATGQLDNVSRLAQVRKEVARVLTVLRERDYMAAEAEGVPHDEVATHDRVPRRLPPITSIVPDRPHAEEGEETEGEDVDGVVEDVDLADDVGDEQVDEDDEAFDEDEFDDVVDLSEDDGEGAGADEEER